MLVICLFYSAACLPMVINGGFYLDDPVTSGFRQNLGNLLLTYTEIGWFLYWPAYLHAFLFLPGDQAGVYIERALIFFLYLGAAFCLNSGLKTLKRLADSERFFVVLLFAVLPVNTSRIALSNLNYAASHFLFFLGFFFLAAYLRNPGKIYLRLCALAAFFISFSTNSLLFFYAGVFLFIFLFENERSDLSFSSVLKRAPAYADFILLPIVFWVILRIFFAPYGWYSDQNHMTLRGFLEWPKLLSKLLAYVKSVAFAGSPLPGLTAALAALFLTRLFKDLDVDEGTGSARYAPLPAFLVGVLLVFAGAFPYLVVLKYPKDLSWLNRHAVLLPLGISLALVYGTVWVVKAASLPRVISTFILSLLAVVYTGASNQAYSRFLREWVKQAAIVEHLRASAIAQNSSTFIFDDRAKEDYDGFTKEIYRYYTWTALLNIAFNDQTRSGFNNFNYPLEAGWIANTPEKYREQYFVKDYNSGGKAVNVLIQPSYPIPPEFKSNAKLLKLIAAGLPPEKLKAYIQVTFTPLPLAGCKSAQGGGR